MTDEKKEPFFDIERDGKELAAILEKIEENLLMRPILGDGADAAVNTAQQFSAPPLPPDTTPLRGRIHALRVLQAPYFILGGRLLSKLAYLFNIPLFIFGRKQAEFNQQVADALERLTAQTEHMSAIAEYQKYQDLQISTLVGGLHTEIEELAEQLRIRATDNTSYCDKLHEEIRNNASWLESVSGGTRGNSEWAEVLSAKQKRMAKQLRELLTASGTSAHPHPEPRIVNDKQLQKKIEQAGDTIRLNLGCGEKPRKDYLNVDRDELPGVDVVADIMKLPFEADSVAEIMSEHLVEHFRQQQFEQSILPYWKQLLAAGGTLRIVCPNWEAMIQQFTDNEMDYSTFKEITFGGQDYEGDDHFSMYTPATMTDLLQQGGFKDIETVTDCRMNGGCPEMELTARKA